MYDWTGRDAGGSFRNALTIGEVARNMRRRLTFSSPKSFGAKSQATSSLSRFSCARRRSQLCIRWASSELTSWKRSRLFSSLSLTTTNLSVDKSSSIMDIPRKQFGVNDLEKLLWADVGEVSPSSAVDSSEGWCGFASKLCVVLRAS